MRDYIKEVRDSRQLHTSNTLVDGSFTLLLYIPKAPSSRSSGEWDTMPELGTNVSFKVNGNDISGELTSCMFVKIHSLWVNKFQTHTCSSTPRGGLDPEPGALPPRAPAPHGHQGELRHGRLRGLHGGGRVQGGRREEGRAERQRVPRTRAQLRRVGDHHCRGDRQQEDRPQ